MRNLLTVLAIAMLLCSCSKEEYRFVVEGYVLDETNNTPSKNAYVVLSGGNIDSDTVRCDENGYYKKGYNDRGARSYMLIAHGAMHCYSKGSRTVAVRPGITNKNNFYLTPASFLQVRVKNTRPVDQTDAILVKGDCIHSATTAELFGTEIDQLVSDHRGNKFETKANQYVKIQWRVRKNGKETFHLDSVFVNTFETAQFNIEY